MYLIDTNVISEARRGERANSGVQDFFQRTMDERVTVYLSVVTIGELRRGVEQIRHRGDRQQAERLERWLERVIEGLAVPGMPGGSPGMEMAPAVPYDVIVFDDEGNTEVYAKHGQAQ